MTAPILLELLLLFAFNLHVQFIFYFILEYQQMAFMEKMS